MDGKEKKEYPSLPPNYVSFAQLQERWLQKQQEEKLKNQQEEDKLKKKQEEDKLKKEEEKKREAEIQNKNRDRRGLKNDGVSGGPPRDAPPGKDGREIQVKGKGKEAAIGDSENGDANKSKKKKNKKKKHYEKNKSAVDKVSIRNEIENEKPKSEIIKECDGGSKGIDEIVNVSVLNVKGLDSGRGLRRNGGNNSGCKSKTEYRVKVNEKKETEVKLVLEEKIEGEEGHFRRRRNGGYHASYLTPNESKGNAVKRDLENKAEDEIYSEICGGLSGIKNGGNTIEEENRVEEKETEVKLVMEEKIEGEQGHFRKWGGRRRNGGYRASYRTPNESKGDEVKRELEKKAKDEICSEIKNGGNKIEEENRVEEKELSGENTVVLMEKVDEEVLVVESSKHDRVGNVYNRRNGGYRSSYRTPNESKGNEVKHELEKKADDEICSEICGGLSGIKNGGNKIEEEYRVEEKELSADNRAVLMEKKVDEEVLVVESGKNGKKGNVYNRRNGNWRENVNRENGGKVRSMVDGRRYGRNGDGWKTRSGNMMWVKKEEKLGADAAEDGSSGISVDQ